jgi:hypothetical protein
MGLDSHIQQLTDKHRKLEETIAEEMAHPDWDELKVKALKIQKLRVKEELERLRSVTAH